MSVTNLQNNPIVVGTPTGIESSVEELRVLLSTLPWIDRPYFIAQRMHRRINDRSYYFPETYAPEKIQTAKPGDAKQYIFNYKRLTPDADSKGTIFFMVGTGRRSNDGFFDYPISVFFIVNLELIDREALEQGLFTQRLITEAQTKLGESQTFFMFYYSIAAITRDLKEVFREFVLDDIESYNRAPMQCFRIDLSVLRPEPGNGTGGGGVEC